MARKSGEDAQVAVRNVRRDANDSAEEAGEGQGHLRGRTRKRPTADVQELTDRFVAKVDEKCAAKEKEIMDL